MKKCPPGVICVENITLVILFSILAIVLYLIHSKYSNSNSNPTNTSLEKQNITVDVRQESSTPGLGYDVLLNPYSPPLRDDRYLPQYGLRNFPINVQTNVGAVDTSYRQVGILTPIKNTNDTPTNKILALMGRPLFTNRDKWQFYTMTKNNIKLPVSRNGKSGTSEYGCDNIYNGDTIYVEGYNDAFRATIYDNDTMRYIPSI